MNLRLLAAMRSPPPVPDLRPRSAGPGRIPAVDGLRALAVALVIAFHLLPQQMPGGYIGVDIFFAISGYVICRALLRQQEDSLPAYLLHFYRRRILRIAPALVLMLASCAVASTLLVPEGWLSAGNRYTCLWAFLGASNIYLAQAADGYFSDRIPFNPFMHTWSLGVEEQFYLLVPVALYVLRARPDCAATRRRRRLLAFGALTLLSATISASQTGAAPTAAFYLLPSRFWELSAGCLLALLEDAWPAALRRVLAVRGILPIALCVLVADGLWNLRAGFPFPGAWVPVGATLAAIGAIGAGGHSGGSRGPIAQRILEARPTQLVGALSYSLYLWHWPVFSLLRWTVGLDTPVLRVAALVATALLAGASYGLVEQPLRLGRWTANLRDAQVVGRGLAQTAGALLATAGFLRLAMLAPLSLSVTSDHAIWSPSPRYLDDAGAAPPVAGGRARHLFLVGDSHAGAYERMAWQAARRFGAEVTVIGRYGCPVANLLASGSQQEACAGYAQDVVRSLQAQGRPGDVVFLASLRVPRISDQTQAFDVERVLRGMDSPEARASRALALEEARQMVTELGDAGFQLVFDAPLPVFRAPAFRCSDWFNRGNPICAPGFEVAAATEERLRAPVLQALDDLGTRRQVHVWDPFPVLCPDDRCRAFRDGKPIFSDGDHLSGYGNDLLVESFAAQLGAIWGMPGPAATRLARRVQSR